MAVSRYGACIAIYGACIAVTLVHMADREIP